MTREEARQIIKDWLVSSKCEKGRCGYIEGLFCERDVEAFNMAIEALEQEPIKTALSELPTIEIVRCKDCIQNTINTDGTTEPWCYKFGYVVEDTDFCSYGERKDNE